MTEEAQRPEPVEEFPIKTGEDVALVGPSEDAEQVVPVRIVESGRAREIRDHRTFVVPLNAGTTGYDGDVTQVVGPNQDRTRVRIFNTHATDPVRILDDGGQSVFTGFLLAAGKDMDIFTEAAIFAAVPSTGANLVILSVIDEFVLSDVP